jgi:hypothetical protein
MREIGSLNNLIHFTFIVKMFLSQALGFGTLLIWLFPRGCLDLLDSGGAEHINEFGFQHLYFNIIIIFPE